MQKKPTNIDHTNIAPEQKTTNIKSLDSGTYRTRNAQPSIWMTGMRTRNSRMKLFNRTISTL